MKLETDWGGVRMNDNFENPFISFKSLLFNLFASAKLSKKLPGL